MKQDISEVILKAQAGDEEAFTHLYQHYYKSAFRYAYKLTKSKSDAEDVVQESFIMIHDKLKDLRSPYAFSRWMSRIILSNAVRLFESHQEVLIDEEALLQSTLVENNIDFLPDALFRKDMDLATITDMIACMRPKQREVLRLVYLEQRTFQEVAELLHLPEGTIKSRSVQAKKVLKRMMDEYYQANEPLAFHEACSSGMILSFLASKLKDASSFISTNAVQVGMASTFVICAAGATSASYELYVQKQAEASHPVLMEQERRNHPTSEMEYPNTYEAQTYQQSTISTSKQAYFTLMNWANTKEKLEKKTKEERLEIQPVVDALQASKSEYHHLLESNGWYEDYESVKT